MAYTAACLALFAGRASAQIAPAPVARPSVIVVPFNAGRDPRGYWLREASAVILADDLVSLGVSAMSRDDRLRAFESLRVPAVAASLSHATVIRVGQIVGAGWWSDRSRSPATPSLSTRGRFCSRVGTCRGRSSR
jgi:hypothetical protein